MRDANRGQRGAAKRKKRERKVREQTARRRQSALRSAGITASPPIGDMPVEDCVVSQSWQKSGLAHIVIARAEPAGTYLVAGFYVDTLCLGLKDAAIIRNVSPEEYQKQLKPNLFRDDVVFQPCSAEDAKAIVEGAIDYAANYGFRPNKRWTDARRIFSSIGPTTKRFEFGRDGKPCLIVRKNEPADAIMRRLDRTVGKDNYLIVRQDV